MAIVLILLAAQAGLATADEYSDAIEVFRNSAAVKGFFENSYGYAIFPLVGKGGVAIGGAYGNGKVYRNGTEAGKATLIKASIGFQLGGQVFSEIIFFQDQRAFDDFTAGDFEFDASVSAVAITAGAQAKAGTQGVTAGASAGPATGRQAETMYRKGMAVFVHAKGGFMFEASIGGQKFSFEPNV